MNGSLDDDIYSIEKLLPAPPKPPKQPKKVVHQSQSCPPLERSTSQQESDSNHHQKRESLHGRGKKVASRLQSSPPTATNVTSSDNGAGHNGRPSLTGIEESFCTVTLNPCSSDVAMRGLQSATSISLLHGLLLISIIITSLAAFVCSKLRDPCEDFFLAPNYDCSPIFGVIFSVFYVLSCLYAFTVYFLHLIGKCDYISWSARRKVAIEIVCTVLMLLLLITSGILLLTRTMALHSGTLITSVVFATVVIVLYALRIGLLTREMKMLWVRPGDGHSRNGSRKDSLQDASFRSRGLKSSLRTSESGSVRSSVPSQVTLSQSSRGMGSFTKKSVSYAKGNEGSSVELEDDVFIETR